MKLLPKLLLSGLVSTVVFGLLLFVPAGTLNYWRAWVFLGVIGVSGWIFTIYFLRTNPEVLRRRMMKAESRKPQKVVAVGMFVLWAAQLVVSVLDHRFGWSTVPPAISVIGNVLVALGLGLVGVVLVQNSHASVTIRVEADQELVSTGLYGLVRHPMYMCNTFLLVGTPLALGSYWGLVFVIPTMLVFALRIRDEEVLLQEELSGYGAYMQKVRYRLVPHVW
jgi:protein-S-isoprenylcysteine O-methyltransferase Ste14